jgi:hypothetical protein
MKRWSSEREVNQAEPMQTDAWGTTTQVSYTPVTTVDLTLWPFASRLEHTECSSREQLFRGCSSSPPSLPLSWHVTTAEGRCGGLLVLHITYLLVILSIIESSRAAHEVTRIE